MNENTQMIVLDGANIGWAAGKDHCSGAGLIEVIKFCKNNGLNPIAFLPNYYLMNSKKSGLISEIESVKEELEKGHIIPVPPRDDDDLYMITFAQQKETKLISNDLYRDYIKSSEDEKAQEWVKKNVVSYTFIVNEFFPNPKFSSYFMESRGPGIGKKSAAKLSADEPEFVKSKTLKKTPITNELVKNITVQGINTTSKESIQNTLESINKPDKMEKRLGIKYLCLICGEGFKKWSLAHNHKKKTGHGSHICSVCEEILPSPKTAKEHQQSTGHDGLKGTWIGQHEMDVKNIPELSTSSVTEHIAQRVRLSKQQARDSQYLIRGFTVSNPKGVNSSWPEAPVVSAQVISEFEKIKPKKMSWQDALELIAENLGISKRRTKGVLREIHSISKMKGDYQRKGIIDWGQIKINGGMFEDIRISVTNLVWGDDEPSEPWKEDLISYFDDLKIQYALID